MDFISRFCSAVRRRCLARPFLTICSPHRSFVLAAPRRICTRPPHASFRCSHNRTHTQTRFLLHNRTRQHRPRHTRTRTHIHKHNQSHSSNHTTLTQSCRCLSHSRRSVCRLERLTRTVCTNRAKTQRHSRKRNYSRSTHTHKHALTLHSLFVLLLAFLHVHAKAHKQTAKPPNLTNTATNTLSQTPIPCCFSCTLLTLHTHSTGIAQLTKLQLPTNVSLCPSEMKCWCNRSCRAQTLPCANSSRCCNRCISLALPLQRPLTLCRSPPLLRLLLHLPNLSTAHQPTKARGRKSTKAKAKRKPRRKAKRSQA